MSDSEARGALKPEHVLRRDISLEDDSSAQGYALLELLAEGGVATAELLMEEEDEVEDLRRGTSVPNRLAPLQAPEPKEDRPMGPGFWLRGQDAGEVGWEPPASERAWGKARAVHSLPREETDA